MLKNRLSFRLLTCLIIVAVIVFVIAKLGREKYNRNQSVAARENVRVLILAAFQYSNSHKGHLPSADNWHEALKPEIVSLGGDVPEVFQYPTEFGQPARHFAMNYALSNYDLNNLAEPDKVVLFSR